MSSSTTPRPADRCSVRRHRPKGRRALAVAAVGIMAAIAPAAAQADAQIGGNDPWNQQPLSATALDYLSYDNVKDGLKVTFDDGGSANNKADDTYTFTSSTINLDVPLVGNGYSPAFTQCHSVSAKVVACQGDKVNEVRIWTFGADDTVSYSAPAPVTIAGGKGNDHLLGGVAGDTLHGEEGVDTLEGRGGYDTLYGGKQYDVLDGGLGPDTIDGGDDGAVATYASRSNPVSVDLTQSGQDGEAGEGDNVLPTVTDITGGESADTLKGNGEINHISGGEGADKIYGRGGNDDLIGGAGGDSIHGEAGADAIYGVTGNDYLYGGTEDDRIHGSAGVDYLYGEAGADKLYGGTESDKLYGGVGVFDDTLDGGTGADFLSAGPGDGDLVDYSFRTAPVTVTIAAGNGDDGEAGEGDTVDQTIERVLGGKAGDNLTGSAVDNVLVGGAGDDVLNGLGGSDELLGETGNDTLKARDAIKDDLACGAGIDTAVADPIDTVSLCETVDLPQQGNGNPGNGNPGNGNPGNGNPGNGTPQPQAKVAGPKVGLKLSSGRLTGTGFARIRVSCPKTAKAFCKGTLRLERPRKGKAALKVGARTFFVEAGRSVTLSVKVAKNARTAMTATKVARRTGIAFRVKALTRSQVSKVRTTTASVRIKAAAHR